MISNRTRRHYAAQESLRQFSLNNSKGIDDTKAITDSDSVCSMTNLTINPDGSLSLRDRMLPAYETGANVLDSWIMYNPKYRLRSHPDPYSPTECIYFDVSEALDISNNSNCIVKFTDYYTYETITVGPDSPYLHIRLKSEAPSVFNVSDSTIVGNCYVDVNSLDTCGAIDKTLYVDGVEWVPRYLKITVDDTTGVCTIEVINPELNQLIEAEGEIPLNPNLTLDNPYAIRDSYNNTVPSVKGILPYIQFYTVDGVRKAGVIGQAIEVSDTGSNSDRFLMYSYSDTVGTERGNFYTAQLSNDSGATVKFRIYSKSIDGTKHSCIAIEGPHGCKYSGSISATLKSGYYVNDRMELTTAVQDVDAVDGFCEYHFDWRATEGDWWVEQFSIGVIATELPWTRLESSRISDLTESCNTVEGYLPVESFKHSERLYIILKAFCNMPASSDTYYATWDYSYDGITWNPRGQISFKELFPDTCVDVKVMTERSAKRLELNPDDTSDIEYDTREYVKLNTSSATDMLTHRIDAFALGYAAEKLFLKDLDVFATAMFRFKIATLETRSESEGGEESLYESTVVDSQLFDAVTSVATKYLTSDFSNAVLGEKLYYNKTVYSFGHGFENKVYASDVGSFITPMYNVVELTTYSSEPSTAVIPWRNYIITATPTNIHLTTKSPEGSYTKVVSTSIGVHSQDARTLTAALSGLVFKSGPRVYLAYPNAYASDDSFLNIVDISKPIHGILEGLTDAYENFAIVVDDMYVLMIPDDSDTHCLRYDLSDRRWEYFTYPVKFEKFITVPNAPPLAHGLERDYVIFENDYTKYSEFKDRRLFEEHQDAISYDGTSLVGNQFTKSPIPFSWDTGQKTDLIMDTRQFVESKLMFATLSEYDTFPFTLYVAIDGDPHVTTMDVTTDAPFWKTSNSDKGVTGTTIRLGGENTPVTSAFNTLRQLVVRYSGKGKSIRHLIEGESLHNFKLYETYVRYKNLK